MASGQVNISNYADGSACLDVILGPTQTSVNPIRVFSNAGVLLGSFNILGGINGQNIFLPVRTVLATGPSVATDAFVNIDATAGPVTFTIGGASAGGAGKSRIFYITKVDASANPVTIARSGTDTIDGLTQLSLYSQGQSVLLYSDGVSAYRTLRGRMPIVANVRDSSIATSATINDGSLRMDATAGALIVTLPLAATFLNGTRLTVTKIDASGNAVTLTRSGADLINGAATLALAAQFDSATIESDGVSNWYVVASGP